MFSVTIPSVLGNRNFSYLYSARITWGGWGSNPRPADYENYGPGAPDALPARLPRSRATDGPHCTVRTGDSVHEPVHALPRPSPDAGHRKLPLTGLNMRELRQAGDVVDLDCPPFFIDRVEDAVPPGPQAPQIGRPVVARRSP
jgi:hypothetical protein